MKSKETIKKIEPHLFTDPSEKAFAGCVYNRITNMDGDIADHLIAAKTKVAPVKTLSLPRLELSGAMVDVKILQSIKAALKASSMAKLDCSGWTDFTIVLQWLRQLTRQCTIFVANRVSQIQETIPRENWKHVPTKENPADVASRGTSVQELINNSLWWKGPDFLHRETIICPQQPEYTNNAPEQRTSAKVHKEMNNTKSLFNFERFSQLTRLLNRASIVTKASQIFLKQPWHNETNANNLAEAKRFVIRESKK